jgi:hypothetical protein
VIDDLHRHPIMTEQRGQPVEFGRRSFGSGAAEGSRDVALAAASRIIQCPRRWLPASRSPAVALLVAAQLGPVIAAASR